MALAFSTVTVEGKRQCLQKSARKLFAASNPKSNETTSKMQV